MKLLTVAIRGKRVDFRNSPIVVFDVSMDFSKHGLWQNVGQLFSTSDLYPFVIGRLPQYGARLRPAFTIIAYLLGDVRKGNVNRPPATIYSVAVSLAIKRFPKSISSIRSA